MADPSAVLEQLDFRTPIPCYHIKPVAGSVEDFNATDFDCDQAAEFLVTWTCPRGHETEIPSCVRHGRNRLDATCWTCSSQSWVSFAHTIPGDYWPGEP